MQVPLSMKYGEVKDAKENVCPNAIGLGL